MMMQFPGMKFTEQGVIMGERWRALTPEEKRPYEEMAAADKERHAKEMREYVEGVRQEMEAGKTHTEDVSLMEWAQVKVQKSMMEQEGSKDASEDSAAEEMGGGDVLMTMGEGGEVRGPRLVDAVILSLSKMLGEESSRRETRPEGSVLSPEIQTEGVTSRHVSPDLTLAELPSFTPPSTYPQTRPHPRPHVPMRCRRARRLFSPPKKPKMTPMTKKRSIRLTSKRGSAWWSIRRGRLQSGRWNGGGRGSCRMLPRRGRGRVREVATMAGMLRLKVVTTVSRMERTRHQMLAAAHQVMMDAWRRRSGRTLRPQKIPWNVCRRVRSAPVRLATFSYRTFPPRLVRRLQ
jgi:hypothetical protein